MQRALMVAMVLSFLIQLVVQTPVSAEPSPVSQRFVELTKKAMSDPYYGQETRQIARAFEYYNHHNDHGRIPPLYIWRLRGALLLLQINSQIRQQYLNRLPQQSQGRKLLNTLDKRYESVADTVIKSLYEIGDRIDDKALFRAFIITSDASAPGRP